MTSTERSSISAFIVCCNEERQIRRCLESVKWCDEIVVVDSGSKDHTLEICREYTSKIIHQEWRGYVLQKRFALEQCSSEWVLNIDADEEVSPELRDEIVNILTRDALQGRTGPNGYLINRVIFFLNRWWRKGGWHPEFRLRLCRRLQTTWGGEDPHEKASVSGSVGRCKSELRHYSFTDLADYVRRMNTLSSNATTTLKRRKSQPTLMAVILRPIARFLKFYIGKRGYREGLAGFIVAMIEAYAVLLKYAKLWEDVNELSKHNPDEHIGPK
jgi:glycosyltransferase involved in cell wall biosynthesis